MMGVVDATAEDATMSDTKRANSEFRHSAVKVVAPPSPAQTGATVAQAAPASPAPEDAARHPAELAGGDPYNSFGTRATGRFRQLRA